MKKVWLFVGLLLAFFAVPAMAAWWNPVDWVKSGLESGGWTALAWVLTGLAGLAVFSTVLAIRIVKTMREVGELLVSFADAFDDRKFTADELKQIAKDARDVCDVWRTTPAKFTGG